MPRPGAGLPIEDDPATAVISNDREIIVAEVAILTHISAIVVAHNDFMTIAVAAIAGVDTALAGERGRGTTSKKGQGNNSGTDFHDGLLYVGPVSKPLKRPIHNVRV
jgi:hypothetical protein